MRTVKAMCLGFIVCFSPLASAMASEAVPSASDLIQACDAESQAGMRDCLDKTAAQSQAGLKEAERTVSDRLGKWDEDDKYIRLAKARLMASNAAFAQYREAQCELAASLSGGAAGNTHEIGRLACVAEWNRLRAELLQRAVANLPLK